VTVLAEEKRESDRRVSVRMPEWGFLDHESPLYGSQLRGLTLANDASTRALVSNLERAGVMTLSESRYGVSVRSGSFIGRIAVGSLDITIEPKISWGRWMALIGYAFRLHGVSRSDRTAMYTDQGRLQDLIAMELLVEAESIIAGGLHREYVSQRKSLSVPRGRIDFARIAKQGGIRGVAIPSRYTNRNDDSVLNRALLSGLGLVASSTCDSQLRGTARRLSREWDSTVASVKLSAELVLSAKRAVDRRTTRYEPALDLIQALMTGKSIVLEMAEGAPTLKLPGFALDMNALWQRLLGRVLGEWQEDLSVEREFPLRDVFRRSVESPIRRRLPRPRPDFARKEHDEVTMFLDAKYRDLWGRSLPPEMLYQLSIYALSQQGRLAVMLYPSHEIGAAEERFEIHDPVTSSYQASVALRPVDLNGLETLISAPPSDTRSESRRRFATALLAN
jgi:5-methylcytosine-specific restriction enzyme subunit McrC